ncbi:hypothetical protein QQZ08_012084 [Neonectria magnoliae]|uniref:BZIP domain-containing protein n=1 Tax=Neonectria magnoliae TaxID=2732573 RepID=A0ABR1H553_9HYPO
MADKRAAVNANRRVANMTSSQIESKRSIDRANQRYCRAKRKTQVDRLQAQVDALTRELEDTRGLLRESQERERTWIGALAAVGDGSGGGAGALQGCGGGDVEGGVDGDGDLHALQPTTSQLLVSRPKSQSPSLAAMAFDQLPFTTDFSNSYYPPDFINANLPDPTWPLDSSLAHQALFQSQPPPPSPSPSRPLPWTGHFALDRFNPPSATTEWTSIPPLLAPTTQLDQVILDTTETLRLHTPRRASTHFPSISSLLNPTTAQPSCDISAAAAAQVGRSPVASLLARVGFMYVLSHLLRWYVCRTKESYDQLPHFIRPTLLQRTVPHPPWIDVIVWPQVRDAIIKHMDWSRFLELRAVTAGSLCVGWPHADTRPVFESVDGENYKLSSVFEEHLRESSNWTVGAGASAVFPFLKAVCRESP